MNGPIRVPISNVLLGNDYTGKMKVGAQQKEVNLLLDTGSSTLAVEHRSYDPQNDHNATVTDLVQEVGYADQSSWIGSVVMTDVSVGTAVDLPNVPVAVAYHETADMFGQAQGILGLAYATLDDAVQMTRPTVPPTYTPNEVRAGHKTFVEPYFTELARSGLVANKYSFYTRRSVVHAAADPQTDPLNNGVLILGGGEEAADLYSGSFQSALVLSDDWYSVNLKAVIVGKNAPMPVAPPTHNSNVPTNAIVDSGTNGLDLAPKVFDAILAHFPAKLIKLMHARQVSTNQINLNEWPDITFVLQGDSGTDVRLVVKPENYWQLHGFEAGNAVRSLWRGTDQQSILGLPLMNGYFTIFDDGANKGMGAVKFAAIR